MNELIVLKSKCYYDSFIANNFMCKSLGEDAFFKIVCLVFCFFTFYLLFKLTQEIGEK